MTTSSRAATTVAVASVAGATVTVVLPLVLWADRLPSVLATHWGTSGRANGSMSPGVLVVFSLAFVVAPAIGLVVAGRSTRADRLLVSGLCGLTVLFAVIFALVAVSTAHQNLDHGDWRTVPGPSVLEIVGGIAVAAVAAGVVSRRVASRLPHDDRADAALGGAPAIDLGPGERAVWIGRCTNRWLYVPSVILGLGGLYAFLAVNRWLGAAVMAGAAATSVLATVTVTVDRRGLRVAYGPLAWPRTTVDLRDIHAAAAIDVRPMRWGGWGYRGSRAVLRQAAVVVRGGPGIRLDLVEDRVFVVTVDDAVTGAALLAGYLDRRPTSPGA